MGIFRALFTPPIPPIAGTRAVVEWFMQHDERISDVKSTVPEPHLTTLKETITDNIDDCEAPVHLQLHLDEAGTLSQSCLETMYSFRTNSGGVTPEDAARAVVLEASASAMLRIYGYFMLKRFGIDPATMDGVELRGSFGGERDSRVGSVVYLDTSAWNGVLDAGGAPAVDRTDRCIVFSSCNMDEFSLAPGDKARQLVRLSYSLSNRRKLLDHVEMTAVEIAARQAGQTDYPVFDDDDQGFYAAWEYSRSHGFPSEVVAQMEIKMKSAKAAYREHLRQTRDLFKPAFQAIRQVGLPDDWPTVIRDFNDEGHITLMLETMLASEGYLRNMPDPEGLSGIRWQELPCTACWIQYHLALSYLASREEGKLAKPDLGDQIDFRHVCYAGIADVFVTSDARMAEVLKSMVTDRRAHVIGVHEFLSA